jgi:hypothetical protein
MHAKHAACLGRRGAGCSEIKEEAAGRGTFAEPCALPPQAYPHPLRASVPAHHTDHRHHLRPRPNL